MSAAIIETSKSARKRSLALAVAMACVFFLIEWLAFTDAAHAAVPGITNPVTNGAKRDTSESSKQRTLA